MKEIRKVIDDPKAPERLRGKEVVIVLDEVKHTLDFSVEVPDDLTAQEQGYLDWSIGEYTDALRERFPFIGDRKRSGVVNPNPEGRT